MELKNMNIYHPLLLKKLFRLEFKSLLDFGCGYELIDLRTLRKKFPKAKLSGFDWIVNDKSFALAEAFDIDLKKLDWNAGGLPYKDKSMDVCLSAATMICMPNVDTAIKEMKRIAKKYIVLVELQGEYKDFTTGESLPSYNTTRIMRDYPKLFGLKFKKYDIPKEVWPGEGWKGEAPGKILIGKLY